MKYSQLRAFEKHIESAAPNHFSDLYMIIGEDRFACKMAIDKLLSHLLAGKKNPELCLKTFDGDNCRFDDLLSELQSISLFSDKQVIWLEQADKLPKTATKALEGYFQQPNRAICFVVSASAVNRSTNFYKYAEKCGVVMEFADEKPAEKERSMKEWVQTTLQTKGKNIDSQACQHLVKQVGTDMGMLHNEVEKLLCYVGDRPVITLQDVGAICSSVNMENAWQLGEALFRRDAGTALRISKALLSDGTALIALIRQIRSQFQTDFQVCSILANGGTSEDISKLFPYMRGFILDRHIQSAQSYGLLRFKKGMQLIDQMETSAKNSVMDPELLAELLIIKLAA